jgi:hypothetical protein
MEYITTPSILENILPWGDHNIFDLVDNIENLELITYNKRKKTIVKQTHRKEENQFK